jgi:long-chain acyl-CoA synthetase
MPARIALSVPFVNSHIHPLVAGPVLASHPLDLQIFPSPPKNTTDPFAYAAHVGPPSVNAEVKLINVQDKSVENGEDPVGVLMVRGPCVGKMQGVGEYSYIEVPTSSPSDEGWVWTGDRAKVLANGAFKVMAGRK